MRISVVSNDVPKHGSECRIAFYPLIEGYDNPPDNRFGDAGSIAVRVSGGLRMPSHHHWHGGSIAPCRCSRQYCARECYSPRNWRHRAGRRNAVLHGALLRSDWALSWPSPQAYAHRHGKARLGIWGWLYAPRLRHQRWSSGRRFADEDAAMAWLDGAAAQRGFDKFPVERK